jgi:hypothetical protein
MGTVRPEQHSFPWENLPKLMSDHPDCVRGDHRVLRAVEAVEEAVCDPHY